MGNAIENMYPLSPMQEGLLFHSLLSPASGTYVPQVVLSFSGKLNGQLLKQAWEMAIARHSILRSGFYWEQRDQPFQIVYRHSEIDWIEQDWQQLSAADQSAKLKILLACNRSAPFNLNQPPLMRLTWVNCGDNRYHLIWCYHHIILDGWSASQLLKEVFQAYFSLSENLSPASAQLPRAYGDYIAWINRQDITAAKNFWKTFLEGWAGPTSLPSLKPTAKLHTQAHTQAQEQISEQLKEHQRPLSSKTTQKLRSFAQAQKITVNTLIQASLGLVLSRYSDTTDIVFGATCAGRPTSLPGALSIVGLFINTLPVRVQIPETMTVMDWLQGLSTQQAATTDYEYVSLRELQIWVQKGGNEGQGLFDCLLVFESYPVSAEMFSGQTNIQLESLQFDEWTHFPLTILVSGEDQLTLTAKYRADQLSSDAVSRFLGHLVNVMTALVKQPEGKLKDISLLCSVEKKQLAEWNQTAVETYPLDRTLPDLFEAQVERTPEVIALIFENKTLTYQALNEKANQLAHHLQSNGIGPEQRVAVNLDRSLEMAIALLGTIKASAAYVPLDPSYPKERLEFMLNDADVSAVITKETEYTNQPTTNPQRTLQPHNSVYVIYTSGSTGKPKGVINTHQGLINRLSWMQQTYSLTAGQRVLHKTPISFDVSVWELFWPLLNGATLVMAKPNGHKDSAYLADLIQAQQISIVHFVPSMLTAFLEAPTAEDCTSLQHVICSGEALPKSLQSQFFQQLPDTSLHNLYGPTEATIDVTAWQCQPEDALIETSTVPIGRPIANTQIHLLDSQLNPVPIGVPGEIHIGGVGLARGYHNRPELTVERFIAALTPTQTLYKTGDLARYQPDGTIEYLGRKDSQIKLSGVRIELGEIESVLCDYPAIRQAAVVVSQHLSGDRSLTAYIVEEIVEAVNSKPDSVKVLSAFLKTKLPDVMVPARFISLPALPLTPNGKLDRRALPKPDHIERAKPEMPRNDTEKAIASIWSTVLSLENISIHDNFFDLGGHSLSATRVNTRLRKHFKLDLPLQSSFEYPTLSALATRIDALQVSKQTINRTQQPAGYKEIEL